MSATTVSSIDMEKVSDQDRIPGAGTSNPCGFVRSLREQYLTQKVGSLAHKPITPSLPIHQKGVCLVMVPLKEKAYRECVLI